MTGDLVDLEELIYGAVELAGKPLAPEVREQARWRMLDTLAVILAGGRRSHYARLVDGRAPLGVPWRASERSGVTPSRLLAGGGGWADPEIAAFVNASAACELELDEGRRPTGHPAAQVLPAVLAAGEALEASLGEVTSAFVAGYEVAAGLFDAVRLVEEAHPHGHLAAVGASVAVAVLCGADPLPAAEVAATLPLATTWEACREGASARNAWAGHAARTGLVAHRLADAGFGGTLANLEVAFARLLGSRVAYAPVSTERPRILGGYFKRHSACALTHPAIEAALRLAPVAPSDVASVEVGVPRSGLRVATLPREGALSRRFSLPYAVAVSLLRGRAGPEQFDDADLVALDLARRVAVVESAEATDAWPTRSCSTVRVRAVSGVERSASCADAPDGLSAAELARKFSELTGADVARWGTLMDLDESEPIGALLELLA